MKTILPVGKVVFLYPKSYQDTQGRPENRLPLCYITTPAGGSSGSIHTADGLLKNTLRRITHEEH